jgi:hypothetical protein
MYAMAFKEIDICSSENWRKTLKIVIISFTPARFQDPEPSQDPKSGQDALDSRKKPQAPSAPASRTRASSSKPSPTDDPRPAVGLVYGEQTLTLAFSLVILTLMVITLAMFKLASAIATLSERLGNVEELLERYALVCLDPELRQRGQSV